MKSTVLVVSSNPQNTSFLRLDRELRIIHEVLQKSTLRDYINIQVEWAVRTIDLLYALQRHKPWIVHFCGHGEGEAGLAFEDEAGKKTIISNAALTEIASQLKTDTECILLNACYSKVQAALMSQHINYVIGMSNAIEDKAALAFTRGFYTALSGGESIPSAYTFGKSQIAIECSSNVAATLTERKATVVGSPASQAKKAVSTEANLMPILFQKETLTEFDKGWMTLGNQPGEDSSQRSEPSSNHNRQQPAQQQTNSVSGITFGSGNTNFNFSPVQIQTGHVNISGNNQQVPSVHSPVTANKQSFQAAVVQLQQTVENETQMNPLLKQGALSQIEQLISELQDAQPDRASLQKSLLALTQGFASTPSTATELENVTRLFHSIWGSEENG